MDYGGHISPAEVSEFLQDHSADEDRPVPVPTLSSSTKAVLLQRKRWTGRMSHRLLERHLFQLSSVTARKAGLESRINQLS